MTEREMIDTIVRPFFRRILGTFEWTNTNTLRVRPEALEAARKAQLKPPKSISELTFNTSFGRVRFVADPKQVEPYRYEETNYCI